MEGAHKMKASTILKTGALFVIAMLVFLPLTATEKETTERLTELDYEILFRQANEAFAETRDYNSALERYLQILEKRGPSVALLQNISNCYYQLDQIGHALLYVERALLIEPENPDLLNNKRIIFKALSLETPADPGFLATLERKLTHQQWFVVFALVANFPIFLWILRSFLSRLHEDQSRKRGFSILVALPLWLIAGICLYLSIDSSHALSDGIVLHDETPIRQSPFDNAEVIGTVGEGYKLRTLDEHKSFYLVQIPEGNQKGWLPKSHFSKLALTF
jgi:tetratricopeptide (TPR) repeat protein